MPTLAELYPAYGIRVPSIGSLGQQSGALGGIPMAALAALVQRGGTDRTPSPALASYAPAGTSAPAALSPTAGGAAPASIRTNNPGAMWPGQSATRFGSTEWQPVSGGNRIAVFSDPVHGAAAQFDLLSRLYSNRTLDDAIRLWSGGNSNAGYSNYLSQATGLPGSAVLSSDLFRDPSRAIPLARAMAQWEAGTAYPMTDAQWQAAHALAFPR